MVVQNRAYIVEQVFLHQMGHSDISVKMNVYTHLGLEDAASEMARMEQVEAARREQEKIDGTKEKKDTVNRNMFRVI